MRRPGAVALAAVLSVALWTSGLAAGEHIAHAPSFSFSRNVPPGSRAYLRDTLLSAGSAGAVGGPLDFPADAFPLSEAALASGAVPKVPVAPVGNLRGEFDKQRAILLGGDQMVREVPELFAELVLRCRDRVDVIVLVSGKESRAEARRVLEEHHVTAPHVHYVNLPHDSMWTRDFGPLTVWQPGGTPALIDSWYTSADRPDDDAVPAVLGEQLHLPVVESPLFLDGGNLLSNGRGLVVATYELVNKNLSPTMDAERVRAALGHSFGATEVVFLDPLMGEPTGHVDMFATFTSAHTVVVGSIAPEIDPENARILDANAARLANVRVDGRKLRVVRVPMPHHDDDIWRTYTNVVYLNGLVLMPIYPTNDPEGQVKALATYRKLLPTWRVEAVDAESLAALGGALHCVTMNLAGLEALPEWHGDDGPDDPLAAWAEEQERGFHMRVYGTELGLDGEAVKQR